MALATDIVSNVKQVLKEAQEVYVLFPGTGNSDIVASALALAEGINSLGKTVHLASPQPLNEEMKALTGADKVATKIGNRNLVISLKVGSRDSIDKVSYNLDEDGSTFNLIIQPKKGQAPLKSEDVSFTYAGAAADLVFLVGVNRFEDLNNFYLDEKKLFSEGTTVSIHRYHAQKFATYHLDDTRAGSLAEIMADFMRLTDITPNKAAATNLLYGIDKATNNLTAPTVTAETFEMIAQLLRAGGLRQVYSPVGAKNNPVPTGNVEVAEETPVAPVPSDWLAPKIFKSSTGSKV